MVLSRALSFCLLLACLQTASATRILSLDPQGNPVAFGAQVVDVSGNGRYAVLQSRQLIPEDTSGQVQVYVYDLVTDEVELISVQPDGQASATSVVGYDSPHSRVISSDGRYVLFRTAATDITPAINTNGQQQVYRRDRELGITEIMSVAGDRTTAANQSIVEYTMDCTGQQVLFRTAATNLTPEMQGGAFLHQADAPPASGVVTRKACSDDNGGFLACANFSLGNGLISFIATSTGVVPNDPPGPDIFVANVIDGNNLLVTEDVGTIATTRLHGPPTSACSGHRIAFTTNVNLFFNPDGTFERDLYVVDTVSGQKLRFGDPDSAGQSLVNSTNRFATISDSGQLVGFQTALNLDPRDGNAASSDSYFIEFNRSFSAYTIHYVGHWNDSPSDRTSILPHLGDNGIAVFMADPINPPWPQTNGFRHAFANLPPGSFGVIFQNRFQQVP
ncbi:hypothetical protein [Wenzhouxiangella marina]|uniref:Uncharacterized protein n=1 Tax=Wenzhouxiangella marina TaxID=1579979 RepID=A0A0K0XXS4_9GAMM|nr:hypothetical protein [Wenzhouxiangella marina]AKS42475.1 hypothetical protein WM2015_2110 [Wenzhouxiangella marina]MBB6085750.1 hypothetical protein [Wenzhouxiangella marina]